MNPSFFYISENQLEFLSKYDIFDDQLSNFFSAPYTYSPVYKSGNRFPNSKP